MKIARQNDDMVGPNKQFDHDETLNKALRLFWEQGYEATSMQALVDAMGINRASMYQTFGNKHELFVASIERYMEGTLSSLTQLLEKPGSALANLQDFFEEVVGQSVQGKMQGCFINNTAVELGPHDAKLAEKIRQVWEKFENVFATLLQRAINEDEIKSDCDAHQLAQLLNINLQGLMVKSKANTSKKELLDGIHSLFKLIQQ